MNKSNRDLLVLFKQELLSPQVIEETVDWLHEILQTTERLNNLVIAHEVLDLNKKWFITHWYFATPSAKIP